MSIPVMSDEESPDQQKRRFIMVLLLEVVSERR